MKLVGVSGTDHARGATNQEGQSTTTAGHPYAWTVEQGTLTLRLGRAGRSRNRWMMVAVSVIWVGVGFGAWSSEHRDAGRLAAITVIAVCWSFFLVAGWCTARGVTVLTPTHLRLQGVFLRRSIPWDEIVGFDEQARHAGGGGGVFWRVRVQRSRGRALTLPGLYARGLVMDEELHENLVKLYVYWKDVRREQVER